MALEVYSFFRVPKKLRHIPAVSAYAMIKSALRGQSRVDCEMELLLPVSHKGNGIYLRKATVWTAHITDPAAAKQFLKRTDVFPKAGQLTNALGKRALVTKFLGQDNIFLTSGHQWKKQRALMNPVFHRSMPIKAIDEGVKALFSVIDKNNTNINVTTMMQHFTLDVLGITAFEQLRHNIAAIFLAGHETISSTLSLCLYNLAKHKHVQDKLRKEVIEVLGDEPVDVTPTLEELKRMEYLNMVIKENFRLYGPSDTIIPREAAKDFNLVGTFIPKGTLPNLDIGIMHRDRHIWKGPEAFIPERFGPNGIQADYNIFTYLPFSNGSRQCIGMSFSLAEQRIFLAVAVKKYEIEIAKDSIHYDHLVFDRVRTKSPESLQLTFKRRY
ncbi:cytochrome P450 [Rhizopus microsporus ATCC 52813]|uniref:Cytochrome P450 n=1 Tax=Rhizopus microsporus ATCC 52813 TaxID=1340429 RepID=A0A2G4SKK2_RHIZD|nr:cytochrome P450 [Rhizopus microsporus ATCC 52813]PHZ09308.1 cytochrome P450 [Rhizopus microsporus ATCC 52813]